jgi:hypothetical protein
VGLDTQVSSPLDKSSHLDDVSDEELLTLLLALGRVRVHEYLLVHREPPLVPLAPQRHLPREPTVHTATASIAIPDPVYEYVEGRAGGLSLRRRHGASPEGLRKGWIKSCEGRRAMRLHRGLCTWMHHV